MKINIFITGGTIDSQYNELNGKLIYTRTSPSSHLDGMLKVARCTAEIETEILMLKDSLEMTDSDRTKILQKCEERKGDKIIITHGTDTMVETAKVLGENVKNKTIVLLGAMIPYSFGNSDSLFNLGCAISAVQLLPKGVYITMNGKIFPFNNVRKNRTLGVFEEAKE